MQIQNSDKFKELKQEAEGIRKKLGSINKNKETWFKRKEELKKDIYSNVQKIKEFKAAKDKNNIELEELKKQRDRYNNTVKNLINKVKDLNKEKTEAYKKYNIKVDPSKIQEKINELEKSVEQEVNFEKEKKLMEEIKKLKRAYEETSGFRKISEKAINLDNEIKTSRKKADEFHKKILEITKDAKYEIFIELSKRINELKGKQEAAFQNFIDHKNEYAGTNKELKSKLEELQLIEGIFTKKKKVEVKKQETRTESYLKKKLRQVQEKIKGKKKLTTEDLLAIQGADRS